ncbi:MAG: serine hydrolase [Clostridiales bacterium]|nr:serine hydrolase [Clostridiales bacterium]
MALDDRIKAIDNRFTKLENITICDLLAHRKELWTDGYLGAAVSRDDFYQKLFNTKINRPVRNYVDSHYIILSVILEKIYGKSFEKIVAAEILAVLGLKNTTFHGLGKENIVSNNFETVNGKVISDIYPGIVHDTKARVAAALGIYVGHAGIFTTAGDFITILKSFIDGKYSLLTQQSIERMLIHDNVYTDIMDIMQGFAQAKKIPIHDNNGDLNKIYADIAKNLDDEEELYLKIIRPYNYGGTRYKNPLAKKNELPIGAGDKSIIFSGYTGPIFFMDFEKSIIILVMTNTCHNSKKNRHERYALSQKMITELYGYALALVGRVI